MEKLGDWIYWYSREKGVLVINLCTGDTEHTRTPNPNPSHDLSPENNGLYSYFIVYFQCSTKYLKWLRLGDGRIAPTERAVRAILIYNLPQLREARLMSFRLGGRVPEEEEEEVCVCRGEDWESDSAERDGPMPQPAPLRL